jgi:hypothetical protein
MERPIMSGFLALPSINHKRERQMEIVITYKNHLTHPTWTNRLKRWWMKKTKRGNYLGFNSI